jgi:hypothetical protein
MSGMPNPPDTRRRQLLLGGTALPLAGWSLPVPR